MKKTLLSLLLITPSLFGFSQVSNHTSTISLNENSSGSHQLVYDGTYLVEMTKRGIPSLPVEINEIVEENRQETSVAYFYLSEYVRIKILPRIEINSPGFTPFERHINLVSNFSE